MTSTSARSQILGGIRRSLGRGEATERPAEVVNRLAAHARNLVPKRAQLPPGEQVDLFVTMATAADATVARVSELEDVPAAVTAFLADHNQPAQVKIAADPKLEAVPWDSRPLLEVTRGGPAVDSDRTSVTACFAGVAETGSVMMTSGPQSPTTLNFMPENHVVVMRASDMVGVYEDVWDKLRTWRDETGHAMPRTVNCITGPSRSADVEQTLQLGAHGPKRLHIIVVDGA